MLKCHFSLIYMCQYLNLALNDVQAVGYVNRFIDENHLPHLLLYGPPGTGKTSTILACAKKLYKPKEMAHMVLELNASDERGIGVVRQQILTFSQSRAALQTSANRHKLIVLDEADAMTKDAQNALRRIMEKYTENVRFCLICNYLSKIIPALQSRCTRFRFAPLNQQQMIPRLRHVVKEEGLTVTEDGEQALVTLAEGDMRRVLNILQSTCMAYDCVNEVNVYSCCGHPLKSDIQNILNWLLNDSFSQVYTKIYDLKLSKGLALQDILTELHHFVHKLDVPSQVHVCLLEKMSDIEVNLCSGASEKLQLSALCAAFMIARDKIATYAKQQNDEPMQE